MEEQKQKYYFNIESGEVLDKPADPDGHFFTLFATGGEMEELRAYLEENYQADWAAYGESHLHPFQNQEREHAEFDKALKEIYSRIYKLGDAEAQNHVRNMGILSEEELIK